MSCGKHSELRDTRSVDILVHEALIYLWMLTLNYTLVLIMEQRYSQIFQSDHLQCHQTLVFLFLYTLRIVARRWAKRDVSLSGNIFV